MEPIPCGATRTLTAAPDYRDSRVMASFKNEVGRRNDKPEAFRWRSVRVRSTRRETTYCPDLGYFPPSDCDSLGPRRLARTIGRCWPIQDRGLGSSCASAAPDHRTKTKSIRQECRILSSRLRVTPFFSRYPGIHGHDTPGCEQGAPASAGAPCLRWVGQRLRSGSAPRAAAGTGTGRTRPGAPHRTTR